MIAVAVSIRRIAMVCLINSTLRLLRLKVEKAPACLAAATGRSRRNVRLFGRLGRSRNPQA
jgi:hypothetical protein